MRYTENLHLNLPEDSDPLDIEKLNENFEALDAAVAAAGGGSYQVGDILYTLRSDLGDGWLPCNGKPFDPEKYPDLANLGLDAVQAAANAAISSWNRGEYYNTPSIPYSLATDGKTIAFIAQYYTGNVFYTNLYISDDGLKTISGESIPEISIPGAGTYGAWNAVFYVNGYWILQAANKKSIFATQDIKNEDGSTMLAGTTDFINLRPSADGSPGANSVVVSPVYYADGEYYVVAVSDGNCRIYHSSSPGFNNYSAYLVPMTNYITATKWDFVQTDKYFVFLGLGSENKIVDIVYSENLLSGYQEIHIQDTSRMAMMLYHPSAVGNRIFWADFIEAPNGGNFSVLQVHYIGSTPQPQSV